MRLKINDKIIIWIIIENRNWIYLMMKYKNVNNKIKWYDYWKLKMMKEDE